MLPALVMAAIAGINALKQNDDAKVAHQNAINDAEQELWNQRNAEIQAYIDKQNGVDPRANAFERQLSAFQDKAGAMPVPQDWTPLVAALGKGAGAVYDMDQKGMFGDSHNVRATEAPELGKDIPGQNFSAAPGRAPDVNFSEWAPVEHKQAAEQPGGYLGRQAQRWQEEEEESLPGWLRR